MATEAPHPARKRRRADAPPARLWFRRPSVVWFRGHDLRVEDHPALLAAAQRGGPVAPLFLVEPSAASLGHAKRWWLKRSLAALAADLAALGVDLVVRVGDAATQLRAFIRDTGADAVFWNRVYEPDMLKRDELLRVALAEDGLTAVALKAELLVEPWELNDQRDASPARRRARPAAADARDDAPADDDEGESRARPADAAGAPFRTFHDYMRAWMSFAPPPAPFPRPSRLAPLAAPVASVALDDAQLETPRDVADRLRALWTPGAAQAARQLETFLHEVFPAFGEECCRRDFRGTSRLSPHVRFGELSPRKMYHAARLRMSRSDSAVTVFPQILRPPSPAVTAEAMAAHTARRIGRAAAAAESGRAAPARGSAERDSAPSDENDPDPARRPSSGATMVRTSQTEGLSNVSPMLSTSEYSASEGGGGAAANGVVRDKTTPAANGGDGAEAARAAGVASPAVGTPGQATSVSGAIGSPDTPVGAAVVMNGPAKGKGASNSQIRHNNGGTTPGGAAPAGSGGDGKEGELKEAPVADSARRKRSVESQESDGGQGHGRSVRVVVNGSEPREWPRGSARPASQDRIEVGQAQSNMSRSARAFLKNLCLRDFAYHILFHHPDFEKRPMVQEFTQFPWAEDNGSFDKWKNGMTGYPIVDAGMRELQSTGWIHNGMRFLLASFLTKYLLLPWQRGLAEFYTLLIDGDQSSNPLGWQWTAGSNTDAFPFSCLVHPVRFGVQQDPVGTYVKRWIPELRKVPTEYIHSPWKAPESVLMQSGVKLGEGYPFRVVNASDARKRARDAMLVMRKIFSALRPKRELTSVPVEELLREWPKQRGDGLDSPSPLLDRAAAANPTMPGKTSATRNRPPSTSVVDPYKAEANGFTYNIGSSLGPAGIGGDAGDMGADRPTSSLDTCKLGLLPSLWSLIHFEEPPSDLPHATPSLDHMIAVNTACLADGTFALGSDGLADQPSIESALLHHHDSGDGRNVDAEIEGGDLSHRGGEMSKEKMDAIMQDHGNEPVHKPDGFGHVDADGQENLSRLHVGNHQQAYDLGRDQGQSQFAHGVDAGVVQTNPHYVQSAQQGRDDGGGLQSRPGGHGGPDPSNPQHAGHAMRGMENFGQPRAGHVDQGGDMVLQAQSNQHSEQQQHQEHAATQADQQQAQQQNAQGSHVDQGGHQDFGGRAQASVPSNVLLVSASGGGLGGSALDPNAHAQMLAAGGPAGAGSMSYAPAVSFPQSSVAPGGGSAPDPNQSVPAVGPGIPGLDASSAALYAQHMGLSSFYGVPPGGVPVVNGQGVPGAYDVNTMNHQMSMQAMLAFQYGGGMYSASTGMVDPSVFGAPSVPNFSGVTPGSASAYMQIPGAGAPMPGPGAGSTPQYTQPVYYNPHVPPGTSHIGGPGEMQQQQHVDHMSVPGVNALSAQQRAQLHGAGLHAGDVLPHGGLAGVPGGGADAHGGVPGAGRDGSVRVGLDVPGGSASVPGRDVNGAFNQPMPLPVRPPPGFGVPPAGVTGGAGVPPPYAAAPPGGAPGAPARTVSMPITRSGRVTKGSGGSAARGRGEGGARGGRRAGGDATARNPRARPRSTGAGGAGAGGGTGRGRGSRGGGRGGRASGPAGAGAAGAAGTPNEGGAEPVPLRERQEILQKILRNEQHEFHAFAKFLRDTYVLTEHTDRQSSRDYIRLCTLKDDFHKECRDAKDKLKIYKVKSFFSKVLKLEVTGEWDRHGHGGIRGPWVYGIRRSADT